MKVKIKFDKSSILKGTIFLLGFVVSCLEDVQSKDRIDSAVKKYGQDELIKQAVKDYIENEIAKEQQ